MVPVSISPRGVWATHEAAVVLSEPLSYRRGVGFEHRLLRQVGPYITRDAGIVAIDMAISDDVEPPGPVGVVVTDAEVLLVASGGDGGCLTKIGVNEVATVDEVEPDVVSLGVTTRVGTNRKIVLDFRYFGITDNTIAKLRRQFPTNASPA